MAVTRKLKDAAKTVKSAAKKAVRKVDKAVVEPVAGLFRSGAKSTTKGAKTKARKSGGRTHKTAKTAKAAHKK